VKRTLAYKYQLKTNKIQDHLLNQFAGAQRYVWNKILAYQNERYRLGEKKLSYIQCANLLPLLKKEIETVWLKEIPSQTLQQTLKDLDRAYTNFFQGRAELPRFKKRGVRDSFRYPDGKQIKLEQHNNRIFLPKLGWISYINTRELKGDINSVTVSRSIGKWFISINFDEEHEITNQAPQNSIVGIDMGITRFATLSNGTYIEPLNTFRKYEAKTIKLSKKLSRKMKFSSNWKKTKAKLSKHHSKISNIRKEFLHKTTTKISNNYQTVVMEDLKVSNMSKSVKGTIDNPGSNIKAKSGLNKSILDQGWYEFRRQLEYKLQWRGGRLITINPQYTSQTCSKCGHIHKDNRESQAVFVCKACRYTDNADINASKNILAAGLAVIACQANCTSSRQQEPTKRLEIA